MLSLQLQEPAEDRIGRYLQATPRLFNFSHQAIEDYRARNTTWSADVENVSVEAVDVKSRVII